MEKDKSNCSSGPKLVGPNREQGSLGRRRLANLCSAAVRPVGERHLGHEEAAGDPFELEEGSTGAVHGGVDQPERIDGGRTVRWWRVPAVGSWGSGELGRRSWRLWLGQRWLEVGCPR
jgi:hypothetical protein